MKSYLRKAFSSAVYFLDVIDVINQKYSDTIALILITVGGILAAVAVGTIPNGETINGYDVVYLKYPLLLREGLLAIIIGFMIQISDNLSNVHKLTGKWVFWSLVAAFFMLSVLALAS